MNETKRLPGRKRMHAIHPSWLPYVAHFDSTNPKKSQNAFCQWAVKSGAWPKASPAALSLSIRRQITEKRVVQILDWENKIKTNIINCDDL